MTPQTVNAVNLPVRNALNFPAAILAAALLRPDAPAAVNYGAIGADDRPRDQPQLRRSGRAVRRRRAGSGTGGRRRTWRTSRRPARSWPRSSTRYRPFPDLHVNGKLTLSENIADVAGLAAAHDGWTRIAREARRRPWSRASAASSSSSSPTRRPGATKIREPAAAAARRDRRARARRVPRRHRPQLRRLVRRLRREAGGDPLPRAEGEGPRVVNGATGRGCACA